MRIELPVREKAVAIVGPFGRNVGRLEGKCRSEEKLQRALLESLSALRAQACNSTRRPIMMSSNARAPFGTRHYVAAAENAAVFSAAAFCSAMTVSRIVVDLAMSAFAFSAFAASPSSDAAKRRKGDNAGTTV